MMQATSAEAVAWSIVTQTNSLERVLWCQEFQNTWTRALGGGRIEWQPLVGRTLRALCHLSIGVNFCLSRSPHNGKWSKGEKANSDLDRKIHPE